MQFNDKSVEHNVVKSFFLPTTWFQE